MSQEIYAEKEGRAMKRFASLIVSLIFIFTLFVAAYGAGQREQKDEYQKKAEATLKELNRKVEELKSKAVELQGDAKKEFDQQLKNLKKKQQTANRRLDKLKSASDKTWQDLKSKTDSAMKELEKLYDRVASKFK